MLLDPQVRASRSRLKPVALALLAHQVRVGRPQDDVDEVGELLEDRRHGPEHVLDALVGREQPERQRPRPALDAELVLVEVRVDERRVGDAVRDQVDLGLGDAVDLPQERPRLARS